MSGIPYAERVKVLNNLLKSFSGTTEYATIKRTIQQHEKQCDTQIRAMGRHIDQVEGQIQQIRKWNALASFFGFVGIQAAITAFTVGIGSAIGARIYAGIRSAQGSAGAHALVKGICSMYGTLFPSFFINLGQAAFNGRKDGTLKTGQSFATILMDLASAPLKTQTMLCAGSIFAKIMILYNTFNEQFIIDVSPTHWTGKMIALSQRKIAAIPDDKLLGWWFRNSPGPGPGWPQILRAYLGRYASYTIIRRSWQLRRYILRAYANDLEGFLRQMRSGKSLGTVLREHQAAQQSGGWVQDRHLGGTDSEHITTYRKASAPNMIRVTISTAGPMWFRLHELGITSGWRAGDFGKQGSYQFIVQKGPCVPAQPPRNPRAPQPKLHRQHR